jgi:hypothetical protein
MQMRRYLIQVNNCDDDRAAEVVLKPLHDFCKRGNTRVDSSMQMTAIGGHDFKKMT